MGEEEDDVEFQATGDACEICAALDGTPCATLPHPNCQCQIVPAKKHCTHDANLHTYKYGSGSRYYRVAGEVTVTCPDGSEFSESVDFDANDLPISPDSSGVDTGLEDAVDAIYQELCDQCPDEEPPNVA